MLPTPFETKFVVLRHEMPEDDTRKSHFDLMIERNGVLLTWALDELPRQATSFSALRLADHRLAYLQYEGPVSDDRGSVRRIDSGRALIHSPDENMLAVELHGKELSLGIEITRLASDVGKDSNHQRCRVNCFVSIEEFRTCRKASP